MDKNSILEFNNKESVSDVLNELLRSGAQKLIHNAVEAELREFMSQHQGVTEDGKVSVIRNGYLPKRQILTGIGPVSVRIPKVRSKDGEALKVLVGHDAQGLSASTVSRLKSEWANEYQHWRESPLGVDQCAYIWADGIYSGLRSEKDKLCALVIIGVNERGQKRFLAIEDGVRESTQSWREVLLKLKSRGMNVPQLAIGDGAMGFWAAMDEVYPQTRHQRCWVHKTANILNSLPKSSQPKAKEAIHEIWQAETKINAEKAFELFIETYQDKYPKATLSLQKDREELLAFYDFPAKHWQSIRTSNPIESTFGTIRHRTKRSKGCLNREGMLHMMFKLGQCAEKNWRKLRGFDYLAKVIEGVQFSDGIEVIPEIRIAA